MKRCQNDDKGDLHKFMGRVYGDRGIYVREPMNGGQTSGSWIGVTYSGRTRRRRSTHPHRSQREEEETVRVTNRRQNLPIKQIDWKCVRAERLVGSFDDDSLHDAW